jgi:uncharacterized membrane-anchored protein YitT (DUF2179 family)
MKRLPWRRIGKEIQRTLVMVIGVIIVTLGYTIFQVPYNIAAGGVSGIAIIVNSFTGWPIGMIILVLNIPLLVLGFFQLGRWRFLVNTVIAVVLFSVLTDIFLAYLPGYLESFPITDNVLLSAIYGGIVGGIGGGLIYRAGATMGGTGIVGRVLQMRTGVPLSQIYLWTDGTIVLVAGLVFGWETALYAMLTLFLNGLATDYVLEGPSAVRTATVITSNEHREQMAHALIDGLGRGVSHWEITGGYTGQTRTMLLCTIYRPQVNDVKRIVANVDNQAFVIIGDAHQALGFGFIPLRSKG